VIEMRGVSFRYPRQQHAALEHVQMHVPTGSLFGLLGPNGSGKTTLISILNGLRTASAGSITIDGLNASTHRRDIQQFSSLVPQENAFYPTLTVAENLAFFASVQHIASALRRQRIDEAVAIAGLERAMEWRADRLSGGMKRRLCIALGLLNQPRLLFLDEPTVGIDPQSRQFLLEAVRRINAAGTTVVYCSHYMDEVEFLCNEIGILDHGRLLVQGTMASLLSGSRDRRVRIDAADVLTPAQREAVQQRHGADVHGARIELSALDLSALPALLTALHEEGVTIAGVQYGAAGLQDVFLSLTSTALRDA
jgi:ABC-2 type transport system ATP-binding protein